MTLLNLYVRFALVAAGASLLLCLRALAQVETQHVLNLPWQVSPRTEIVLHSRFRTRPTSMGLYQGRGGAILNVAVPGRTRLIVGYYFSEQEELTRDWEGLNRVFGGFETLHARWKGDWRSRHVAESHNGPGSIHYYRVRHRFGWMAPTRVAPFSNVEIFWDRDGWRSTRYQAGTAWRMNARVSWDLHYFYEPRRIDVGPAPRHMWGSTLEVKVGSLEKNQP